MKRIILFCMFFAVIVFLAPAATVFVYIERGDIALSMVCEEDVFVWVNRLEDGVMDILFDSGHIVFSNNSGRNQISDFRALNRLARSGGAEILVSVTFNLKTADNTMIISGEYKVYNLNTSDIIYSNNYVFSNALQRTSQGIAERLFLAGQSVGKRIESIL
ncbi:MAG: hypothetical protein FWC36_08225 [Spirochaetes bacterium]|nr:hypothetical protein [Spirochaetota bacterium]